MEANNLYQDINGRRAFGGVVKAEDKGLMMVFDQWNHDEVKNDIPVGINLNLMRAMDITNSRKMGLMLRGNSVEKIMLNIGLIGIMEM
jgi:hypothetical protein